MSTVTATRKDIRLGVSKVRISRERIEPRSSTKIGLGPVLDFRTGDRVVKGERTFLVVIQNPRTGEIFLRDTFGDIDRAWPGELKKL